MQHITREQRYAISAYRQTGWTQTRIAKELVLSQAAISKELKRNKTDKGYYSAKIAQELADIRKERYRYPRKFTKEMERYVQDKLIHEQWSPEQIVGDAKIRGIPIVSVERIYQYIRADKVNGGTLYKHLRHKLKHRKRWVGAGVKHIPNRVSIHERPPDVDERSRFGDWEMDLIESTNGKEFILTLVERTTRFLIMEKLPRGKHADDVAQAVVRVLLPYKKNILTITTDNGGEFAKHHYICSRLSTMVYFADPYSSWQKGTVENTNKLIRQYIPKGSNFSSLSDQNIKQIQMKLNRRPRKKLNFDKPVSAFFKRVI